MEYTWNTPGFFMEYTWNKHRIRSCSVMLFRSLSWMLLATGIVICKAIVCLLCCTLAFVQVLYHALTETSCSHHIIQITSVNLSVDGQYIKNNN